VPELPEVETIARTLGPDVTGRAILRVEVLDASALAPDAASFAALTAGRRIVSVGRRAKLLLLFFRRARAKAQRRTPGKAWMRTPGRSSPCTCA